MILRLFLFFVYGLLLPKRNTSLLYNSIGDMNIMHQICCISIGSFMVYVYMYFILCERLCVCVCTRVCILLCKIEFCVCVCFYSPTIAVPANFFFVEFDPTLHKDYLILSYFNLRHFCIPVGHLLHVMKWVMVIHMANVLSIPLLFCVTRWIIEIISTLI